MMNHFEYGFSLMSTTDVEKVWVKLDSMFGSFLEADFLPTMSR